MALIKAYNWLIKKVMSYSVHVQQSEMSAKKLDKPTTN